MAEKIKYLGKSNNYYHFSIPINTFSQIFKWLARNAGAYLAGPIEPSKYPDLNLERTDFGISMRSKTDIVRFEQSFNVYGLSGNILK